MLYFIIYPYTDKEKTSFLNEHGSSFISNFLTSLQQGTLFIPISRNTLNYDFLKILKDSNLDNTIIITNPEDVLNDLTIVYGNTLESIKKINTILDKELETYIGKEKERSDQDYFEEIISKFSEIVEINSEYSSVEDIPKLDSSDIVIHMGNIPDKLLSKKEDTTTYHNFYITKDKLNKSDNSFSESVIKILNENIKKTKN